MKEGKQLRMCLACRNKKNKWYANTFKHGKQMKKNGKVQQTNLPSSVIKIIQEQERFTDSSDSESVENQFHMLTLPSLFHKDESDSIAEADSVERYLCTPPLADEEVDSKLDVDLLFSEIINWSRDFSN
jgi:hypothetical protein